MQPEVAVVVITYNSEELVEELLDSVPAALGGHSYGVVVVDNDSHDGTVAVVSRRPEVTLVRCANDGYSAGINAGAAVFPDSETIMVLNPDVRLMPGSVAALLDRMRVTGAGVVAPRTLKGDGDLSMSLRREPTLLRAAGLSFTRNPALSEYVHDPRTYDTTHVTAWAVGAALLVSRACHDSLGGWDESYFLYSEETDFCLRAADHGWLTFYEPTACVTHIGGASGRSEDTHAMQILNRVRLYSRRHRAPAAWAYYALTLVSEASWLMRGQSESRASLRALARPALRPRQLRLRESQLPR